MERRTMLKGIGLSGSFMMADPFSVFATLLQDNHVTQKIRGTASIFKARGGTILWSIDKKAISVIDSQFPEQARILIGLLKEQGDTPFRYLFNTHHHGDHSGGNIAFKGLVKNVIAHANSASNQKKTAESAGSLDSQLIPDLIFGDQWKGKNGKESISCSYFGSAHTNGDSVIHLEDSNVAHVGDLVFNRRHPYIDRANGANIGHWIIVLDQIISKYDKETIFISGHSGEGYDVIMNKDDIKAFKTYLEILLETVSSDLRAGRSKEEILSRTELPGLDWNSSGISRPLTAAYEELTEN